MTTTGDHVTQNAEARAQLSALIERLSDADLGTDLGGGWTASAALAHLAFWDGRVARILDRWQREGRASDSPVDDDPINEALTPLWAALGPREAARLALNAAEEADARIEALAGPMLEAALASDSPINIVRANHRREHIAQIEAALRR